jgi:hypothetical protein
MQACRAEWRRQQRVAKGVVSPKARLWVDKQVHNNFRALRHQWQRLTQEKWETIQSERSNRRSRNKALVRHTACAHICERRRMRRGSKGKKCA